MVWYCMYDYYSIVGGDLVLLQRCFQCRPQPKLKLLMEVFGHYQTGVFNQRRVEIYDLIVRISFRLYVVMIVKLWVSIWLISILECNLSTNEALPIRRHDNGQCV